MLFKAAVVYEYFENYRELCEYITKKRRYVPLEAAKVDGIVEVSPEADIFRLLSRAGSGSKE
jgi:hypothetical protein